MKLQELLSKNVKLLSAQEKNTRCYKHVCDNADSGCSDPFPIQGDLILCNIDYYIKKLYKKLDKY